MNVGMGARDMINILVGGASRPHTRGTVSCIRADYPVRMRKVRIVRYPERENVIRH